MEFLIYYDPVQTENIVKIKDKQIKSELFHICYFSGFQTEFINNCANYNESYILDKIKGVKYSTIVCAKQHSSHMNRQHSPAITWLKLILNLQFKNNI